jgi:KaiC/GvpD/RAD55 family RecA-like ATPase
VVIDPISVIGMHIKDRSEFRRMILNLSTTLKKLGTTCFAISEIVPGKHLISRYGVEEFIADGIIVLYYERDKNKFVRNIQIFKMKGDDHSKDLYNYDITPKGIVVLA